LIIAPTPACLVEHAPRRLTDAQVDRILLFARPKESPCIRLAVHTGLRWGELRTLQWRHVVMEPRPHLVLEATKSGRVRRVPLSVAALEAIQELRGTSTSVFVSPYRAVNSFNLSYRNRDRMPKDDRVVWHWHQLRHTFACRYLERGGSLAAFQRMLGHSTSRMTERYASLSDEALFADLDRVERATVPARGRRPGRDREAHVAPNRKPAAVGVVDDRDRGTA
jgi:integrase